MWAPADINALPTLQDISNAKKAIDELKFQIQEISSSTSEPQSRVTELLKELTERCAWIAPCRRAPMEILSLIFEYCGKEEWKSPLRIAAVSKRWRNIVLGTPSAWSYLNMARRWKRDVISTYLQRSAQCPLHIFSPKSSVVPLSMIAHRLHCLSIETIPLGIDGMIFPSLTWLSFRHDVYGKTPLLIRRTWFPSLRHLSCGPIISSLQTEWTPDDFPPLLTLFLIEPPDFIWFSIVRACRNTLSSLRLHLDVPFSQGGEHQIVLPRLQCLELQNLIGGDRSWPIGIETPMLETYIEHHHELGRDETLHTDLANVRRVRTNRTSQLSFNPLPNLELIQSQNVTYAHSLLDPLLSNQTLCPNLKRVELSSNITRNALTSRVAKVNSREISIQVVAGSEWPTQLRGSLSRSKGTDHIRGNGLWPILDQPPWKI